MGRKVRCIACTLGFSFEHMQAKFFTESRLLQRPVRVQILSLPTSSATPFQSGANNVAPPASIFIGTGTPVGCFVFDIGLSFTQFYILPEMLRSIWLLLVWLVSSTGMLACLPAVVVWRNCVLQRRSPKKSVSAFMPTSLLPQLQSPMAPHPTVTQGYLMQQSFASGVETR